jgi:hypothetical protein
MLKGQARNIEIFKVGAGRVDEFGINRQQNETAPLQRRASEQGVARTSLSTSLSRAEEVADLMREAIRKAERRKRKAHKTS